MKALGALIVALTRQRGAGELVAFGVKVGHLYTDQGFPIDMALDRLSDTYTKEQKMLVLYGACQWLIEHRRNSNASEAAIERQRKTNKLALEAFWNDKETGMY